MGCHPTQELSWLPPSHPTLGDGALQALLKGRVRQGWLRAGSAAGPGNHHVLAGTTESQFSVT